MEEAEPASGLGRQRGCEVSVTVSGGELIVEIFQVAAGMEPLPVIVDEQRGATFRAATVAHSRSTETSGVLGIKKQAGLSLVDLFAQPQGSENEDGHRQSQDKRKPPAPTKVADDLGQADLGDLRLVFLVATGVGAGDWWTDSTATAARRKASERPSNARLGQGSPTLPRWRDEAEG